MAALLLITGWSVHQNLSWRRPRAEIWGWYLDGWSRTPGSIFYSRFQYGFKCKKHFLFDYKKNKKKVDV